MAWTTDSTYLRIKLQNDTTNHLWMHAYIEETARTNGKIYSIATKLQQWLLQGHKRNFKIEIFDV